MKVKEGIVLAAALESAASTPNLAGEVNYCVARNLKKLKKEVEGYYEENKLLAESFCEKDEKGSPLIVDGKYKFSEDNAKLVNEKHKELFEREFEFAPYTIKRSSETDKLPGIVQVELLDLIIVD